MLHQLFGLMKIYRNQLLFKSKKITFGKNCGGNVHIAIPMHAEFA